jgi:hypothetical protein
MSEIEQSQPDGGARGETINLSGVEYLRIPFGQEFDHWSKTYGACPDCGALQGEYHEFPCDIEECPDCGGQFIGCGCLTKRAPEAKSPSPPPLPDPNQTELGL